ncbi:MAG: hypothetical protein PHV39_04355 [Methanomicrobium sp.]|nr:hypothetical protein [Methanomicrobium sp.]
MCADIVFVFVCDDEEYTTRVRYNCDTGEIEDSLKVECHDEEGLVAMEGLIDIKNSTDGEWTGLAYVYNKNGISKEIRPSDEDLSKF